MPPEIAKKNTVVLASCMVKGATIVKFFSNLTWFVFKIPYFSIFLFICQILSVISFFCLLWLMLQDIIKFLHFAGMDAQVSYAFHSERKLHPDKFKKQFVNQVMLCNFHGLQSFQLVEQPQACLFSKLAFFVMKFWMKFVKNNLTNLVVNVTSRKFPPGG